MPVRVGIVGCGKITQVRHAPEYAQDPRATLSLVWDADPGRARDLAQQYGARVAATPEEVWSFGAVDAVSICTPNHLHGPQTVAALTAGVHVLCEKPMAASLAEARAMNEAARKAGKVLMIGHNQRFYPVHQRAKELIAEGAIGRLLTFRSRFRHAGPERWGVNKTNATWFFDKARAQYGALGDLGTHKIDLMRYVTGLDVAAVQGWVATVDKKKPDGSPIDLEDEAHVRLKMTSGLVGSVEVSWCHYGTTDNDTLITGDRGVLLLTPEYHPALVVETLDGRSVRHEFGGPWSTPETDSGVIRDFLSAITDRRPPLVTGADGQRALEILEASFASAASGRWVEVPRG